ncbi:hypothetical protein DID88_006994 [Monilinia fructigena]|uniref:Alpha/beta hydrolase fold-3 domain-containing protein n=1 Tax=Monilinia fructigena TaxID=38457 RepID=A0A395IGC5_9HELO|nr:hypothetical protein DID88_006994 [Monilinia fructigena]
MARPHGHRNEIPPLRRSQTTRSKFQNPNPIPSLPSRGTLQSNLLPSPSYLSGSEDDEYRYPVVVNYHGGGFTLGTGTDDARWASAVIHTVDAVFVSVEYRLAPEFPFSVGVEDGTDAVIYLASHAEELRLDPHRMALSGFSAGGNFAFTVPLMLHDLQNDAGKRTLADLTNLMTNADGTPVQTPVARISTKSKTPPHPAHHPPRTCDPTL